MPDLASLRQEFADLHQKASTVIEKATAEGRELTADEKTETDKQFARMDTIKAIEAQTNKLAAYKFAKGDVQTPAEVPGRKEAEQVEGIRHGSSFDFAKNSQDREEFAKAAREWAATGNMPQRFATITTATQSGILLPQAVTAPIVPVAINTFRAAHNYYGVAPLRTSDTGIIKIPVLDAQAGGVVSETASSDTDAPPSLSESMTINCALYQSGSAWYSNLQLAAVDFDLLGATVPALEYSKELGLESAVTSGIIADATITQSVTTSATASFKYGDMVALNRALPKRFDQQKVIVLSTSAFIAAEGMVDANGRPILTLPDPQAKDLRMFSGTPVIRSDYFQALGTAGNVLGVVFSLMGFRLRDSGGENLARYVNVPTRPAQTGLNLFAAHGWGYAPNAVAKFVNHA